MPANERILVLGVGNPLVRDEGVGVRVVEELVKRYSFPETVEVADVGTMGMSILGMITSASHVVMVDAVDKTGCEPGTVVLLTPEDLAPNQVMHSLHDVRFVDVLRAAELTGRRPSAEIVGVQVREMVQMRMGLSDDVEAAVPAANGTWPPGHDRRPRRPPTRRLDNRRRHSPA